MRPRYSMAGCDHRLRAAFDTLADSRRRHNPCAADISTRARARGAGNAHATRVLAAPSARSSAASGTTTTPTTPTATPPSNAYWRPQVDDTGGLFIESPDAGLATSDS